MRPESDGRNAAQRIASTRQYLHGNDAGESLANSPKSLLRKRLRSTFCHGFIAAGNAYDAAMVPIEDLRSPPYQAIDGL